jgi:hypothetical protein
MPVMAFSIRHVPAHVHAKTSVAPRKLPHRHVFTAAAAPPCPTAAIARPCDVTAADASNRPRYLPFHCYQTTPSHVSATHAQSARPPSPCTQSANVPQAQPRPSSHPPPLTLNDEGMRNVLGHDGDRGVCSGLYVYSAD